MSVEVGSVSPNKACGAGLFGACHANFLALARQEFLYAPAILRCIEQNEIICCKLTYIAKFLLGIMHSG